MNYAWIENGVVTNIIWLSPSNAHDFPLAVPITDRPVALNDTYSGGRFYRDGAEVLTRVEELEAALAEIEEALNE